MKKTGIPHGVILLAGLAALLTSGACSRTPDHLPGGKKASEAALAAGEDLGNTLGRGITRSEQIKARSDLEAARRALEQYSADTSSYPQAGSCAELAGGLGAVARTLRISGTDPWGSAYECRSGENGYALRSYGPDGEAMSPDDIVVEGGTPF